MSAHRLLNLFQPKHYDLYIDVNRKKRLITGKVVVSGHASQAKMALHEHDMKFPSVLADGKKVPFKVDNSKERLNIQLPKAGDVTLTVQYSAPLTDKMMGIYPSYYKVNGVKKELVGTQFETDFARQAFPCVDEPAAKATWTLALKFDEHKGEIAISNMPEKKVENGVHYFETTRRMSSYLIAFAFGEMQYKMTQTKDGVKIGVFATKAHKPDELDFSLNIAKNAIEFYEKFYGVKYPLPHSWQLALPDFSAGAMENWGLVTYRESLLLLDPENTSFAKKQLVATVVCHELAHQWFGDLVTMKWWNDIWLNESFANMMEYVCTNAIKPEFHIWDLFQTSEVPQALQRDAIDGVQAIQVHVEKPADINELFDPAIVYAKGARMLVMVRALLGDKNLRKGLNLYLNTHKYHNAEGNDLWSALGKVSGMDIGKLMHTWLAQPGYPVVNMSVNKDGDVVLSQKQFFIGKSNDVGRQWDIPLNANFKAPKVMESKTLNLGKYENLRVATGKPLMLNVGNNSHFIVKYDHTLLSDLIKHADQLGHVGQLQLLEYSRLLAEAHQVSYASVVPLLLKLKDSKSAIVNQALYHLAGELRDFVTPDSADDKQMREFFDLLTSDQFNRLGVQHHDGGTNDDDLVRKMILREALYANNPVTKQGLHNLFDEHRQEPGKLSADVRGVILANEMKNYCSEDLYKQFKHEYETTVDPSYKTDLMLACCSASDPQILDQIMNSYKDSSFIKPQDLRSWFASVLDNPKGQQVDWDWFRTNWKWLVKTLGGDMEFSFYITLISRIFHTPQRLAEFKAFFDPKKSVPGLDREITLDEESVANKVSLIQTQKAEVMKAIK